MVVSLRLHNHKGLKKCAITNLSRINILCGKNNSGKTTILEAINSEENRSLGYNLTKDFFDKVLKQILPNMGWNIKQEFVQINKEQHNVTLEIVFSESYKKASRRPWHLDEQDEFIKILKETYDSKPLVTQYKFPDLALRGIYNSIFEKPLNTILLPPKRYLQVDSKCRWNWNTQSLILL